MGSNISYNNTIVGGKESQKPKNEKKRRRRDSINRPVLKLQIRSNSMERQHKMNGETSLDHPFLKRLSTNKFESLKEEKSERDSIQSISSLSSFAVNNVTLTRTATHSSLGIRTSTLLTSTSKPLPRSVSTGYENSPPPSVITVQFVNNGADSNGSLSDIDGTAASTASASKESEGDKLNANVSLTEREGVPAPTNRQSLMRASYITEPVIIRNHHRTQSMEDLSLKNSKLRHKASIRVSRYITHSTSLHDDLDDFDNIQVLVHNDDWSFGENIIRSLEAEGIVLFNIEEPMTTSEKEVEEAWPELKDKMKKWRSEQSLLDL
ncbi:PREDICTED: uncharacterized protein LOC109581506 [Amphimedon queenslandica]|uniref:Uncharacterized protein n=1 Tax=Amphimedon queenslandica TaxID=400682 RepID=A0A1X7VV38_AMPQE|nr:PREDICTED: uncharacterized protein LOC109581506 [Amphimedon queenslandica]|eukprot:XP_019851222.1 PREDICTED: uncharacterized protein LOC109581506 [Amphimedon queenslandica]